jgi:hypothetical protein
VDQATRTTRLLDFYLGLATRSHTRRRPGRWSRIQPVSRDRSPSRGGYAWNHRLPGRNRLPARNRPGNPLPREVREFPRGERRVISIRGCGADRDVAATERSRNCNAAASLMSFRGTGGMIGEIARSPFALDRDHLHLEDECGIRPNVGPDAVFSVSQFGGNKQLPL